VDKVVSVDNSKMALMTVLLFLVIFLYGFTLVVKSTKNKGGKWGLSLNPIRDWFKTGVLSEVQCPSCGYKLRSLRRPKDISELLWGGWTCPICGAKVDKWGNKKNHE
jgi:rubredoxin